jgi:hypothetical protein
MTTRPPGPEASTGQLIAQATDDISRLVRDELQLAKQDLATTGKRAGVGVGLFGAAGTFALYGLGALIAAAILGLATVLDGWLAALIVAAVLFVIAGIAGLVGKKSVAKVGEAPQARVESVKTDVASAKGHAPHGEGS